MSRMPTVVAATALVLASAVAGPAARAAGGSVEARCDHHYVARAPADNVVALVVIAQKQATDTMMLNAECVAHSGGQVVRANGRGSAPLTVGAGAGSLPPGVPVICLSLSGLYLDGTYVTWPTRCTEGSAAVVAGSSQTGG